PMTSSFLPVPLLDGTNLFCSAQAVLPDGRVLVAGGHFADDVGLATGRIFDPATNLWSATPDMSAGRWYPTLTTLPNGKVLVLSGEEGGRGDYARVPEVYDPATNTWSTLPLASLSLPYYPHAFVLPNGRVAVTGTAEAAVSTRVLDVATQTWTMVSSQLFDAYSSAMYLPGKILKTGKSTNSLDLVQASAGSYVIDMTAASPIWRQVQSMAFRRAYHVETLLPDGSVLVTGGGQTTGDYDIPNAVYAAELWSPTTETWTTLASMQKPRLYHGSALLLPDGRVLVTGGGRSPGPDVRDQENLEIFSPPYLFKGTRPTITSAPASAAHNQPFAVSTPDASSISKVALVSIGNMTHGINMSQRYIPLSFAANGPTSLTVTAPVDTNLAPPGIYMLFIIDAQGVPSIASFLSF
ncbi:MAG TPA: galactose oxidase-like domain-containing protein, partial [Gemmatimonadaceae bacterium]|nr:galactose oxidase-like domain-containing protein [Gemmatimonadaceae bacterium]